MSRKYQMNLTVKGDATSGQHYGEVYEFIVSRRKGQYYYRLSDKSGQYGSFTSLSRAMLDAETREGAHKGKVSV